MSVIRTESEIVKSFKSRYFHLSSALAREDKLIEIESLNSMADCFDELRKENEELRSKLDMALNRIQTLRISICLNMTKSMFWKMRTGSLRGLNDLMMKPKMLTELDMDNSILRSAVKEACWIMTQIEETEKSSFRYESDRNAGV